MAASSSPAATRRRGVGAAGEDPRAAPWWGRPRVRSAVVLGVLAVWRRSPGPRAAPDRPALVRRARAGTRLLDDRSPPGGSRAASPPLSRRGAAGQLLDRRAHRTRRRAPAADGRSPTPAFAGCSLSRIWPSPPRRASSSDAALSSPTGSSSLLWLHRRDFGVVDPLFHRDVGFFVFSLPLYQRVADWLFLTVAVALACAVVAHIATGAIRTKPAPISATRGATPTCSCWAPLLLLVTALEALAEPVRASSSLATAPHCPAPRTPTSTFTSRGSACSCWSRSWPRRCCCTRPCGARGRCPPWHW